MILAPQLVQLLYHIIPQMHDLSAYIYREIARILTSPNSSERTPTLFKYFNFKEAEAKEVSSVLLSLSKNARSDAREERQIQE